MVIRARVLGRWAHASSRHFPASMVIRAMVSWRLISAEPDSPDASCWWLVAQTSLWVRLTRCKNGMLVGLRRYERNECFWPARLAQARGMPDARWKSCTEIKNRIGWAQVSQLRPCLVPFTGKRKIFFVGILPIWSTKWSLFTKLFAWMGCKSRDESNEPT